MIHRQNFLDIQRYLRHCERVRQNESGTVVRYRTALRHLLEWADDTPFGQVRRLDDPAFPRYLLTARDDGKPVPLAPASLQKTCVIARQFFRFARTEWPLRYKPLAESWIESLQPPRGSRLESVLPVRELWTLDQVRRVLAVSAETVRDHRGQMAVALLFLSGMRADALASIPWDCVDWPQRTLYQLPARGVRTKNRKAAKTFLLEIPELLAFVERWHLRLAASRYPPQGLWYAPLTTDGRRLLLDSHALGIRRTLVADDIKILCAKANLPYLSPHKLRHGHAVYALKRAHNMAQLKAISQNIMHASVVTTDKIYGRLVDDDVRTIIAGL